MKTNKLVIGKMKFTELQFMKYALELANQEYRGDLEQVIKLLDRELIAQDILKLVKMHRLIAETIGFMG